MQEFVHEFRDLYLYTPTELEKLGGVWPLRLGRNQAKVNYAVGPKVIECYSLHFVLSGSLSLGYGNETVRLKKNDVFCLHPGTRYKYSIVEYDKNSPLRMCWIAFNGEQAASIVKHIGITEEEPYLRSRMTPELMEWIKKLFDAVSRMERSAELAIPIHLYSIFHTMAKYNSRLPEKSSSLEWLQRSIEYMNTHFMEGITVSEAVQVAGVHRSHFYNEFNRQVGSSPRQYLIKLRMDRAAELLIESRLSVTEIALSIGYPDLYSFSRAFYNYYGQSPSVYRSRVPLGVAR